MNLKQTNATYLPLKEACAIKRRLKLRVTRLDDDRVIVNMPGGIWLVINLATNTYCLGIAEG